MQSFVTSPRPDPRPVRPDARGPRVAGHVRGAGAFRGLGVGLALVGLALSSPAAADGWEVRVQEDPFEGTLATIASSTGDERGSRLAVECLERDGAVQLRLRLLEASATRETGAAVPATEVLLRVDAGATFAFRPPDVAPATGVGGGLLIEPVASGARAGSPLADLARGERAWVKVRTEGRDYLHAYDLAGAGDAIRSAESACGESSATAGAAEEGADARVRTDPASTAAAWSTPQGAAPVTSSAVSTAGPAPSVAALAASIPPEAMTAAVASLPSGVTMDGLIEHLDTVIGSIDGALRTAADGDYPDAGLDALHEADERLENFRALFRRLPAPARAALAGIVDASTGRLRSLSDSALGRAGSGAVLGPPVASIFETLTALGE